MYMHRYRVSHLIRIKVDEITCSKVQYKQSDVCHVSPVTIQSNASYTTAASVVCCIVVPL
jgi:hypothetical protein